MSAVGNRSEELRRPRFLARWIRRLAVPIILGWMLLLVALNVLVPQLEVVAAKNSVSMSPSNAPSMQAMSDMGRLFEESESDSVALIVLESENDQPLGDDARAYYDQLIDKLEAAPEHVRNIQDTWGDPLTEAAAQSSDGRAAYATLNLAGNMGEAESNEAVAAVRDPAHGMSRDQLAAALSYAVPSLSVLNVSATAAWNASAAALRARVVAALGADRASHVLANFYRPDVGEVGGGHWSPLVAYDPETDLALLLDVARYKYPPAWVPLADLAAAMVAPDPDNAGADKSRGILVVGAERA